LTGSTFGLNAFAAPGDRPTAPNAVVMQRLQERQAVMLDAHLAAMRAGLKLRGLSSLMSKPRTGGLSNRRSATPKRRARIDGAKRKTV
jgi:hypothetical protein